MISASHEGRHEKTALDRNIARDSGRLVCEGSYIDVLGVRISVVAFEKDWQDLLER